MLRQLKNNILNNWNLIRIIRLILSIVILIQAVQMRETLFGILGVFFLFQALSNTGCCVANSCAVNPSVKSNDDVEIVEIKEASNGNQ